jgi:hypothetical protein
MLGASLRDNLMFGRIGYGVADARRKVAGSCAAALARAGLDGEALPDRPQHRLRHSRALPAGAVCKLACRWRRRWSRRRRSRCSTSSALLAT